MKKLILSSVAAAFLSLFTPAVVPAGEGHRQHGIHQHGEGSLDVVMDGSDLYIELISPAADIVGFEHQPRSAAQEAVLQEALRLLQDGGKLFNPAEPARCRLVEAEVVTGLAVMEKNAQGGQKGGHSHDHGPTPGHGHGHDGKGHDHGHHQPDTSRSHDHDHHAEFEASYRYSCAHPEAMDELEVRVLEFFPSLQRLMVRIVTDRGQKAAVIDGGNRGLRL
jgi:hypothetical protein